MRQFLIATIISAFFSLGVSGLAHAQTTAAPVSVTCPYGYTAGTDALGGSICYAYVNGSYVYATPSYSYATTYVASVSYVTVGYYPSFAQYGYPYASYYGSNFGFNNCAFGCFSNFNGFSRFGNGNFPFRQSGRFERNETEPVCPAGQHESERGERCR